MADYKEPAFLPVAADGQALPFADGTFDAVVCQLGLQFFPNPDRYGVAVSVNQVKVVEARKTGKISISASFESNGGPIAGTR